MLHKYWELVRKSIDGAEQKNADNLIQLVVSNELRKKGGFRWLMTHFWQVTLQRSR